MVGDLHQKLEQTERTGRYRCEEEGMSSKGFVPEESRVKMIVSQCDLHIRKATVKCGQMMAGILELFNLRETTIIW
jgi:hypothetical protein